MNGKTFFNIDKLQNWSKNPRKINSKDFERLKKQIKLLGQFKPLTITSDGVVLGGNMRLKAFRELGITDIWVETVDAPTEKKKLEYALADNDRAGFYVKDELLSLMIENPDFNWGDYAVDLKEPQTLDNLFPEEVQEDETPEIDTTKTISKEGEIYQLGKHKLICGDATKSEDIARLMGNYTADMVFTDPPYNVDYEGKTKDSLKIENDNFKKSDDFNQFLYQAFSVLNQFTKQGASIYVCHADTERVNFTDTFRRGGWKLAEVIIWVKDTFVMGRQDYQWQHEPILYGWKEGSKHTFLGGRSQTTVWNIDRPKASREHPTMKPIKLIAKALLNSSKEDDIILDTFGGSGSTLIACEQTNRVCFMSEKDPVYCDVIRKRYSKLLNREDWQATTPKITV